MRDSDYLRMRWTVIVIVNLPNTPEKYHRIILWNAELIRSMEGIRELQPVATCRRISIIQLLSLWRHSHYDVIRYWAGHVQRHGRSEYGHLTAFNI